MVFEVAAKKAQDPMCPIAASNNPGGYVGITK